MLAGTPYLFGVYAPQLKAQLGLTQSTINTISSFMNLGQYVCVHAGILFDAHGPLPAMLVAAVLAAAGYTLMFLLASGAVPYSSALMCLAVFVWANGSSFGDTTAVAANVSNFPGDRGLVLGLMKSSFGLSAGVLTILYGSFFQPNVNALLRFLAAFVPVAFACVGLAYRVLPLHARTPASAPERRKVSCGYVGALALAAYVGVIGGLQHQGVLPQAPLYAYVMAPLVLMPLLQLAPASWFLWPWGAAPFSLAPLTKEGVEEALVCADSAQQQEEESALRGAAGPSPFPSSGAPATVAGAAVVEAVGSLDFVLFFFIIYAGTGSGLVIINNLGSLAQALGAPPNGQDLAVILLSASNCVGRMAFGALSDAYAARVSRPVWLVVGASSMAGAMALAAFAPLGALPFAAAWAGFSFGAFWAVGPPLVADRFGNRAFGGIYSVSMLAPAVGSYSLSLGLAAAVYEANIGPGGGTVCLGAACYRATFLVLSALCVAGAGAALWLTVRLAGLYRGHGGRAVPYDAYPPAHAHGCFVRALQRVLGRVCCCSAGRALLSSGDGDALAGAAAEAETAGLLAAAASGSEKVTAARPFLK